MSCELSQNIRLHHGFYLLRNTKYSLIAQSALATKKTDGLHTIQVFFPSFIEHLLVGRFQTKEDSGDIHKSARYRGLIDEYHLGHENCFVI